MKKAQIFIVSALLAFLLSSCVESCQTPECWKAKAEYETSQAKIQQENVEARRKHELETLKAQAEIENAKPESVRLQEAKNEETSVGESIETATKIGAGAYVGVKVLDILTR